MIIVTPIKESQETLKKFMEGNSSLLRRNTWIVIDSLGGESVKSKTHHYVKADVDIYDARRIGYRIASQLEGEYLLNLDADVILPSDYLEDLRVFLDPEVGALSTFFENRQHFGTLEFGCSIWRKRVLLDLYDYSSKEKECECLYMWRKLNKNNLKVLNLPFRVKHIGE